MSQQSTSQQSTSSQQPMSDETTAWSSGGVGEGTSPFDEPTTEFPVSERAGGSTDAAGAGVAGSAGSGLADDSSTRQMSRAQVVDREDDMVGVPGGAQQTQRVPTYEELSSPRREPTDIAASMDRGLDESQPKAKRGTLDLGLLVLRMVLGAIVFAHGLQKLTGQWGGPDLDGFHSLLDSSGFQYAHALSIAGPVGEVIVGALLVLGLLTPIAAAGAIAILVNAWCFVQAGTPGVQFFTNQSGAAGSGVEFETMLLAAAVALTLTGPGLISLDVKRGWVRRPLASAWLFLVIGVAAGVVVWIVFNGANPFG